MIDERHEELASLYALDLLEGAERTQFETALTRDPELQTLVRELRDAASALAHTAVTAPPPAALKARVLASIGGPAVTAAPPDNVIRPPASIFARLAPWAIAAGLALLASWTGQRYLATRTEADLLRQQQNLSEILIKDTQQQLEAERIVTTRRLQELDQQIAGANGQLADARAQLADHRTQIADRDRQLATLTQRLDTLTGSAADAARQLAEAKQLVAKLTNEMKSQGDLANLKIAALASLAGNSPEARAVAVWDPAKQEGMFALEKMPALAADQKLELWVVEAKPGAQPVSAGTFDLGADGVARVKFKPTVPVTALAAFAISREKDDGQRAHTKPAEVIMLGTSR
jgi:anti-sigma-K factor RskA